MNDETPAQDIRNALMILSPIIVDYARQAAAMDGADYETVDSLNAVQRRLQDALRKLEAKPELDICSGCHEHTEFYIEGGNWQSVCCNRAPVQITE